MIVIWLCTYYHRYNTLKIDCILIITNNSDYCSFAGLWGILNNAGVAGRYMGPLDWLTLSDYDDCMSVNLYGLIDVTITLLPLIKKARGRVVNTASVFGRVSILGNTPYSVSKFGVEAFSDELR